MFDKWRLVRIIRFVPIWAKPSDDHQHRQCWNDEIEDRDRPGERESDRRIYESLGFTVVRRQPRWRE